MRKNQTLRTVAIATAAGLMLFGAMSMAEAGSAGAGRFSVGGGSLSTFHTNPGGKYVGSGAGKFHSNPGGKYVYRGSNETFHSNPGGKYVYPGGPDKYDHHHYGPSRRYGYYPWYGLPLYSNGEGCDDFYRRAVAADSAYWWNRYRRCSGAY